jgi:hypothetical protein
MMALYKNEIYLCQLYQMKKKIIINMDPVNKEEVDATGKKKKKNINI